MEPLSVTVQATPEDLAIYLRDVTRGKGARWRRWFIIGLAGVMVVAGYFLRLGGNAEIEDGNSSTPPVSALIFIIVFVGLMVWQRWRVRRQSFWQQYAPGALEPTLYQVLDEGFYSENTRGQSVNRWTAVMRLLETEKYLYVMLALRTGYVLPKRCFATPEAATAFAGEIRQRLGRADTPQDA